MKRLFVVAAVMVLACAASLRADEKAAPGASGKPAANSFGGGTLFAGPFVGGSGRGGVASAARWYIDSIDKIVNLTDAQKKAITASIEARDKAMQEFQAKNAEKLKAAGTSMMEAYKAKDKEAIAKVQKAYQDLYAPLHEAMKKSQAELDNVLTAEQKEKLQDNRAMNWIKSMTDPVQLTDEQMKKLKAAYGELTKTAGLNAIGRSLPDVIQSVLTAQQKATIAKHRAMIYVKAMFARAKLNDEQMKRVEALVNELVKDANLKTVMDGPWFNKLAEKIRVLLTAEQKDALQSPMVWGGGGSGGISVPGVRLSTTIGQRGIDREALERRYKELSQKGERLMEEAKRAEHEAHEIHEAMERSVRLPYQAQLQMLPGPSASGQLMPGQTIVVRRDPAIEELRCQVQQLQRQVEELKAMVKKADDKKSPGSARERTVGWAPDRPRETHRRRGGKIPP